MRSTHVLAPVLVIALLAPPASAQPADQVDPPPAVAGWSVDRVAPGISVFSGTLGEPSPGAHWTVIVRVPTLPGDGNPDPDLPTADLGSRSAADQLAERLRAAGQSPQVDRVDWPDFADTPRGQLGWRVRVGTFPDRTAAQARASELTTAGFTAAPDWTGQDGDSTAGPWKLHVAVIDPRRFTGRVAASYGQAVSGRETTSAMAVAQHALLGTNGGFFVIDPAQGIAGEPAGIGLHDGQLQSEAVNGRPALVLAEGGRAPRITPLRTAASVRTRTAVRELDGVNRVPGLVPGCGGVGGDRPTELPLLDVACTDDSELVLMTPQLGGTAPRGAGLEAVLDEQNVVTALRPRGGPVPTRGSVLQAVGNAADWLRTNAQPGTALRLDEQVYDADGRSVHFGPHDDVINGGPGLVSDGRIRVDAVGSGIVHAADPSFVYSWGVRRNPRTAAGIDGSGRLLLVTVDGRQPGVSEGFSIVEAARFLRSLGAVDALNLDGGGSTTMAVRGKAVNVPSDATGERPVGDAVLVVPKR
ncbi:MAG TPA: phosphodiester glycosidase family protein [Pseudonocardiaceae bacterium]|jgi:hypothetical protein|nr:phosphodiester glycosidase family protein [Pseudonocardiaceae bacterium]